ncbi:PAS domain-containing protein [Undibacterium flavidum]|uniref:histidine kinase n=1 Tax=Undibacterium flavidum TaxID=2762297 RepID=A0ABR6Y989_9BURK|nr:PAS domain-containing sensor histidine kinase [Undibacterium flavidum]MBC3873120.1 PAS domain-containing protein [Undibacterium flavidum]
MEKRSRISLRWRLTLIIFLCLLLPSSTIVGLAYYVNYITTRNHAIEVVGISAQNQYNNLLYLLHQNQTQLEIGLADLEKNCAPVQKNRACVESNLRNLIHFEAAESALFLMQTEAPIQLGELRPFDISRIQFAEDQLAYFLPRETGRIPSFLMKASTKDAKAQLYLSYSVSNLQDIFVKPKELGNSGETFLADAKGFFITSARYKSLQGHGVEPISSTAMQRCLSLESGESLGLDYREIPIIHGFRYVKAIGGGCVMAHVDQAEAFSPVKGLSAVIILISFLLSVVGAILALALSNKIARPIEEVTQNMAEFDLALVGSQATMQFVDANYHEIETLARTFDAMADKLSSAVRDKDALLNALNLHAIVSISDASGNILDVNEAFCQRSGYSRSELLGKNHRMVNSGRQDAAFWAEMWRTISSGKPWRGEVCNSAKDGSIYWVDTFIAPFTNIHGEIEKYVAIRIDITTSKNNELAMRAANEITSAALEEMRIVEERLAFAFDGSGDGVWDWDIQTNKVLLSKRWKAMLGHEEHEIGDELIEWSSRVHPDDMPRVMNEVQANLDGKTESFSVENRILCKDGSYLWILDRGKVVARDAEGKALRMIGTHTDISQHKELERIKAELISTVSHELRTPVTSIRGALGLLEAGVLGELPTKAMDFVKVAHRNSQRLLSLVNDILDMDKLLSGKMSLHLDKIDLNELIQDAISVNAPYAANYRIEYRYTINDQLALVQADYQRLMQVMANLMSNAAKFSVPDGHVDIRAQAIGKMMRIEVEDYGCGMPNAFQARVFEAFSQADSATTRKQGGTGLGLNITKKIVEAMGGEIDFSSVPDRGSRFWFTLPIVVNAEDVINAEGATISGTTEN